MITRLMLHGALTVVVSAGVAIGARAAAQPASPVPPPSWCKELLPTYTALSFEGKLQELRALAPKLRPTSDATEQKMVCLFLSVGSADLSRFKFQLEYDGDDKDLVEYVFHDIDRHEYQRIIIAHFNTSLRERRVKVLTDVDDTLFANLVDADKRYKKGTVYPGVVEFYQSLGQEPAAETGIPITTLSARPNLLIGPSEEDTLRDVRKLTQDRLRPSGQSGKLVSSSLGTLRTLIREQNKDVFNRVIARLPVNNENRIGQVKFANCQHFAAVYPEYRYVFVGDSGQGDPLTAQLLTQGVPATGTSLPITTFIHDLARANGLGVSDAFRGLKPAEIVTETSSSGRGIIVHRNYIQAAVITYAHRVELAELIDASELSAITVAALNEFEEKATSAPLRTTLEVQYKSDAQRALALLTASSSATDAIQQALDRPFWRGVSATQ